MFIMLVMLFLFLLLCFIIFNLRSERDYYKERLHSMEIELTNCEMAKDEYYELFLSCMGEQNE